MSSPPPTVHASAVRVGDQGILIRGPSGAGKSRLAFDLILAGRAGIIDKALLVGDDRVVLTPVSEDIVMVRPAPVLIGLLEVRGLGIRRCPYATEAPVTLVVDLAAADAERLPAPGAIWANIEGVEIPRIPVAYGVDPLRMVLAALLTTAVLTDRGQP